jgi:glycosyltransferase involved in cell wall biosynthesis
MKPIPDVSVVIPVVERHGDLERLFGEYAAEIEALGRSAEYIFVVDYREREVIPTLRELQEKTDRDVTLVLLGGTFGESSALTVGLERARGGVIVTAAAYFQVEPRGIRDAFAAIDAGADMVIGRRYPRVDSWFNRLQSGLFHGVVNLMTSSGFKDISSGFRVMRSRVARELNVYGGMHRFIPILARNQGFKVEELDIPQRSEDAPTRYYGIAVYLKRMLDVLTIFFLIKFTRRPLRFFGLIGLAVAAVGGGITLYLGIYRILGMGAIAGRPLLLLGVLLIVLGIQTLSLGLIGEIIIFTHARSIRDYQVAEVIEKGSSEHAELPAEAVQ